MGRRARQPAQDLSGPAAEAYASTSRRLGLGLMLAVLLAAPALSASLTGDMSSRDLAVRCCAALIVARLAVELIARVVNPRPAAPEATRGGAEAAHRSESTTSPSATGGRTDLDQTAGGLPGAVGDNR